MNKMYSVQLDIQSNTQRKLETKPSSGEYPPTLNSVREKSLHEEISNHFASDLVNFIIDCGLVTAALMRMYPLLVDVMGD